MSCHPISNADRTLISFSSPPVAIVAANLSSLFLSLSLSFLPLLPAACTQAPRVANRGRGRRRRALAPSFFSPFFPFPISSSLFLHFFFPFFLFFSPF